MYRLIYREKKEYTIDNLDFYVQLGFKNFILKELEKILNNPKYEIISFHKIKGDYKIFKRCLNKELMNKEYFFKNYFN